MSDVNRHDDIQGEIIHVYDGIEEADNELPLWWLFTFYGAVIFGVFYWFYFEGFEVGESPMQAYTAELAESAASGGDVSAELIEGLATDPAAVAEGRDTFIAQCAVCHREDGGGNIGPNLTDPNWIHGGSPVDIYNTIRDGVPTAAMPAWGAVLGPVAVQQVTAYVVTLRNTNVDGKEAQGEVWSPGGTPSVSDDASGPDAIDGEAPSDEAEPADADDADEAADEGPDGAAEAAGEGPGAGTGTDTDTETDADADE